MDFKNMNYIDIDDYGSVILQQLSYRKQSKPSLSVQSCFF